MNDFIADAVKISVLLNPFAVLSTFLALAGNQPQSKRMLVALHTCAAALAAGCVVLFSGELLFTLLGINLDLFKVGGGVILMVCAVSLVWGREGKQVNQTGDGAIAVVPLAIPMAVGPGTAAGLIVIGSEHGGSLAGTAGNLGALGIGIAVLALVLFSGVFSKKILSRTALNVITRLTGLFLSAIAAQMILTGVKNCLSGTLLS